MRIFLISIAILSIGIVFLILYNKKPIKKHNWMEYAGTALTAIGIVFILASGTFASVITVKENVGIDYENAVSEREMIVYRIENQNNNIIGNEFLYKDILDFNNKIRSNKKAAKNKWINWYCNEDIAAIEYIEYRRKNENE